MSRFLTHISIVILAAVTLMAAPTLGARAQEASPTAGDLPQIATDYATAWSSGDPEQVAALYAEDGLFEEVVLGGAVTRTRDELRDYVAAVYAAFPDFTATPRSAFASGNQVVIEWVLSGTYQGQFGTLPAGTGQPVEVRIGTVLELGEDGLIQRDSEYWDLTTLLTQVGAMPGAQEATPEA